MRVAVDDIRDELVIEEDIQASSWDMDSFDIKFVDNVHIACRFSKIYKELMVSGSISFQRDITCSRCLSQARQAVKQDFTKTYNIEKTGKFLELDNDIREEIILNFPNKVLCSSDCKGLCPHCGVNLNIQTCKCNNK